jgi:hypothetical protein
MLKVLLPTLVVLFTVPPAQAQYRERDAWAVVREWYNRFLHREPDPAAHGWVDALRSGQPVDRVLVGILGSDEYYKNAGTNPSGLIHALFWDLAGRNPSSEELRHFLHEFRLGDRRRVVYSILARYPQDGHYQNPTGRNRYDYRRPHEIYR